MCGPTCLSFYTLASSKECIYDCQHFSSQLVVLLWRIVKQFLAWGSASEFLCLGEIRRHSTYVNSSLQYPSWLHLCQWTWGTQTCCLSAKFAKVPSSPNLSLIPIWYSLLGLLQTLKSKFEVEVRNSPYMALLIKLLEIFPCMSMIASHILTYLMSKDKKNIHYEPPTHLSTCQLNKIPWNWMCFIKNQ